jgi:hypothetical protein
MISRGIRLEGVAFAVLRHLGDDLTGVAELAHLSRAPCVQVALFRVVQLVLLDEELELVLHQGIVEALDETVVRVDRVLLDELALVSLEATASEASEPIRRTSLAKQGVRQWVTSWR